MPTRLSYPVMALVLATALGIASAGWAQEGERAQMLPGGTRVTSGKLEFRHNCAPCHGSGAKGDGPVAAALKTKPANLTLLAKNNHGVFPAERVTSVINGSEVIAAHGSRIMPIWGIQFSKGGPGVAKRTDQEVAARIKLLVDYIESIQEK